MLDIIIPMAGEGRRFKEAGYLLPKPFIDVAGKPMITRVMESITPSCPHRFQLLDRSTVGHTEGAVDTLLRADIDPDNPVLVANCDQLIAPGVIDRFLAFAGADTARILTFTSTNPHHSYVTKDEGLWVTAIAEKQVISDEAVVGIYWFQSGQILLDYANKVIANNARFKNEFYVSEMFKLMTAEREAVTAIRVDNDQVVMLGTPEELTAYLESL